MMRKVLVRRHLRQGRVVKQHFARRMVNWDKAFNAGERDGVMRRPPNARYAHNDAYSEGYLSGEEQ